MMKRVIPFTKYRYLWFTLSILIFVVGLGYTLIHGYNIGIDFRGGLSQQIQIAPVAFTLTNSSNKTIDFNLSETDVSILKAGEKKVVVHRTKDQPLADLAATIESTGDLKLTPAGGKEYSLALLIPLHDSVDPKQTIVIHHRLEPGTKPDVNIDNVRTTLSAVANNVSIQEVGDLINQEFILKVDPGAFQQKAAVGGEDVFAQVSKIIITNLEKRFGENTVIEKQRESLGPQLAQTFLSGSIIAIVVALGLMLIYVTFRFRFNYAVASIIALVHDTLATLGFIGLFQIEFNTAVVAALLTIIGYSMNDTIVIFDRIRENEKLLKGRELGSIMDISITQTLNRSIYTHVTTFIAIFPLFILGTGAVKDFSSCMLFGIVVGAYSSVCNASPIVLMWQNAIDRGKRAREIKMFGKVQTPELAVAVKTNEQEATKQESAAEAFPLLNTGTGPVTRVQRVLEKKKKKKHHF